MQNQNKGNLYLIPTVLSPDTNEKVLSPEISKVVERTDHFFVENIRTARRFISSLKTKKVIDDIDFIILDKDTQVEELYEQMTLLDEGVDMGVVSESGCPVVADPGALVVSLAHEKGIRVIPLVGPSSILLSLMASGFNGQQFRFNGYLPIDKQKRKMAIKDFERDMVRNNCTQIIIETPYRNDQVLSVLAETLHPNTKICVAVDITGESEMIKTLPAVKWRKEKLVIGKVPAVFLIGQ